MLKSPLPRLPGAKSRYRPLFFHEVHRREEVSLIHLPTGGYLGKLQELGDDGVLFLLVHEPNTRLIGRKELLAVRTQGVPRRISEDEVEPTDPSAVRVRFVAIGRGADDGWKR
jgi:hypothetical protein